MLTSDAYFGLRDLFALHPHVVGDNLAKILEHVVEGVVDGDKHVRHALVMLLQHVFPTITEEALTPFLRLLVAYACSALSHMQRAVRKDALSFLKLLLDHFGSALWAFHAEVRIIFTILSYIPPCISPIIVF